MDALVAFYLAILQAQLATETYLAMMGYRRRRAIYGAILFAQDEWVKA